MSSGNQIDAFIKPESVTIIGATQRPGAWGSIVMESLLAWKYPGEIYPVNHRSKEVFGIPAIPDIASIDGPVDLAVIAIPEERLEETVKECGEKGFRGIAIITAGFGEAVQGGREREKALARLAGSYGMRILGPNVSGTYNLQAQFNASGTPFNHLFPSSLAAVCQGGYAICDLMSSAFSKHMGVGKFIHTGNECDLQLTDFLEHFGKDPDIQGILMYVETLRNGNRFIEVAKEVAGRKPVVVHKAGRTAAGARAARSHTGALAGRQDIFLGAFKQTNIIRCPTMELLFPLTHALVERPPMRGNRVGVMTVGGSWGVTITDFLEDEGLTVPVLSDDLQHHLKELGMPVRASTRNPVDIGAAGIIAFEPKALIQMGRDILLSGEVDALVLHGFGGPGFLDEKASDKMRAFLAMEKQVMMGFDDLEKETGKPVVLGCGLSHWESQAIHDLNEAGIRTINRLDEIACVLSRIHQYWGNKT
ncbi:MAG: CoA-binding protein [Desulfatiglans sp.]|nr:CoA-binding protein [Desulfatiglans sp.]